MDQWREAIWQFLSNGRRQCSETQTSEYQTKCNTNWWITSLNCNLTCSVFRCQLISWISFLKYLRIEHAVIRLELFFSLDHITYPLAARTVCRKKNSTSSLPLSEHNDYTVTTLLKVTKETFMTYLMSMSFFCCWASILVRVSLWILQAALPYFDNNSRFSILKNNTKKNQDWQVSNTWLKPGLNRMWTCFISCP